MSNLKTSYDWELLESPVEISGNSLQASTMLSPHPEKISIKRDENYCLHLTATGRAGAFFGNPFGGSSLRSGETIQGEDIKGQISPCKSIVFHNVVNTGISRGGDGFFTLKQSCHKISTARTDLDSCHGVIDYLLGCPDLTWSGGASRIFNGKLEVKIVRGNQVFEEASQDFSVINENHSRNCSIIETVYGTAYLSQFKADTPDLNKLGPCSLHFMVGEKRFEKDFRNKWIKAISFFIGKRLIPVGSSIITSKGYVAKQESHDPYSNDLKRECASPAFPPGPIEVEDGFLSDSLLSTLVAKFLSNYDEFNLGDVISNLWFGRTMPLGMNLVGYAAALESLTKSWFQSSKSKGHGAYVPSKDFEKQTKFFRREILKNNPNSVEWAKVVKNIEKTNRISISDRGKKFFDEIEIEIGPVEEEALSSRNKFAHGSGLDPDKIVHVIKAGRAYETLLSRCILKIIDAEINYFDYSTYDFPTRDLKSKMAGAEGDFKLFETPKTKL